MKRILIVEDDMAIGDALQTILVDLGYAVELLPDGSILVGNDFKKPDLIILDKQLPGIDGLDLCRWLKDQHAYKEVPVIMLSASPHIAKLAREAGADDALEKPFKMNALRSIVEKHTRD